MVVAGFRVNTHGSAYTHGKTQWLQDKAVVRHKYFELEENLLAGQQISVLSLAKVCAISWNFGEKVVGEITSGQLINPSTKVQGRTHGKGASALADSDGFYLFHLWTLNN